MKKSSKSYFLFIGSMLIFSTIGIFRRYIPFSSEFLAFARGILGSAFLVVFCLITGHRIFNKIPYKTLLMLVLIGALIGINWMLLFEAYEYTSVSTATLCYYMEPAIVITLSPVFLNERLTVRKLLCTLAAVLGMVLVSGVLKGTALNSSDIRGILCGLGAAAFYSAVVILSKKIPNVDTYEKTAIQLFSAAVVMIPYLLFGGKLSEAGVEMSGVTALPIIMVVIVGIIHTGIAYAMYFGGMEGLKGQSVAIFSYIDPVGALILSAVFLSEWMDAAGIIGAVLIIGAAMVGEGVISIKKRSN